MKKGLIMLLIMSLMIIPLISAYTWGYGTPMNYLDNEWAKFTIVFLLLFISIYTFFMNRTYNNKAVSVVAGAGISLLLCMAIIKRGLLDSFLNENIVDWILIIAVVIAMFFLIYWLFNKFKVWWGFIGLIILALIPFFVDLEQALPASIMYGPFGDFIALLEEWAGWILLIAVIIILILLWRWFRRGRGRGRGGGANVNVNVGGGSGGSGVDPRQIARQRNLQARQLKQERRQAQINKGHYKQQKRSFGRKPKPYPLRK